MKRHFYLSDNLADVEALAKDLEGNNIQWPHIHILTRNEADLENRQLHSVDSLSRQDVVPSTLAGFFVGVLAALVPLLVAYFFGLQWGYLWIPVIFLSIILLGFCTWEGGLIGFQRPHREFQRFDKALARGKHVLIIDVPPEQQDTVQHIVAGHPKVRPAGTSGTAPGWFIGMQKGWHKFIHWAP